jgi:hypothetical protein
MDSKLWNLEYGIYGIDLKNGIWNVDSTIWNGQNRGIYGNFGMEFPKLWNFIIMLNIQGSQVLNSKTGQIRAI